MEQRHYRTWMKTLFFGIISSMVTIGLINYAVDPLWCFSHSFAFNDSQASYNERMQKTNRVTFGAFNYDSLILGSSRTTYINQDDFTGLHAFNYSAASMLPTEYGAFVEYAKQKNQKDFRYIIIGMDFYGSNEKFRDESEEPEQYFQSANSFLYRYKMLLSLDTLRVALVDLKLMNDKTLSSYHRNNTRSPALLTPVEKTKAIRSQLKYYHETAYSNYRYREKLPEILSGLKAGNPGARFRVFTTPVSEPLFCLMVRDNLLRDYERWIRDLVAVFGEVYNFMYLNSITRDFRATFQDAHHLYPKIGSLLAHKVVGYHDGAAPSDFGVIVNRNNIEDHLALVRKTAASCEYSEIDFEDQSTL